MFCPIHNPSGGEYDPLKEQYKIRRVVMRQETRFGVVTSSTTQNVPIIRQPFKMPANMPVDAPSVVQLDNTKKITSDFAAITITAGNEPKRTYIFNVKLLPSNSPARQISTALMYVTEERFYNRFERWAKQNRNNSRWLTANSLVSVDVMRCYEEGKYHTPPSPGPVINQNMWESLTNSQAVSSEFVYVTGFKNKPIAQTENALFGYILDQINRQVTEQKLSSTERTNLIRAKITEINNTMFIDARENNKLPKNYNDIIIHPLDLTSANIIWVGANRVDNSFVNKGNTADLKSWFMTHDRFHVPNKQYFVDNGFNLAEFLTDGSIYIKSNARMTKAYINSEKLFQEAKTNPKEIYTAW